MIDSIPGDVIAEGAKRTTTEFPGISGRVCRGLDGKIGRFGWKAQIPSLYEFTLTACAVELGLNVPNHPQSRLPFADAAQETKLDLNEDECLALVDYLRKLPQPISRKPVDAVHAKTVERGAKQFAKLGCAACHSPTLGKVKNIYSDLLVHDMGADLGDTGGYSVLRPNNLVKSSDDDAAKSRKLTAATRFEWRTPPLWACRDSAPYLHDGRAQTLEQAIAFHGGEAAKSAHLYYGLSPQEQGQVIAFLRTLTAPAAQ